MRYLKVFGTPLRNINGAAKLNNRQLAFGKKQIKGKELNHNREVDCLKKIKDIGKQGFSYHKIAMILNSMDIPAKNRKKWHAATVMKLVKAAESKVTIT